jgi:hypothetical protein
MAASRSRFTAVIVSCFSTIAPCEAPKRDIGTSLILYCAEICVKL